MVPTNHAIGSISFHRTQHAHAANAAFLRDSVSPVILRSRRKSDVEPFLVESIGQNFFPLSRIDFEGGGPVIAEKIRDLYPCRAV